MTDPEDPITQLAAAAVSLHELFIAYVGAGFTEPQALYLVGQTIASANRGPTG